MIYTKNDTWLLLVMADKSLISARTVRLKSYEFTVGIQSNGLWFFDYVVKDRCPPKREDAFLHIPPSKILIGDMLDIFGGDYRLAAETHASWLFMRKDLLNCVQGGRIHGYVAGVSA